MYLYLKNIIKIEPTIIFTGDSAGGNMVTALTSWLIINNMKVPNILMLSYPVLDMNFE